MNKGQIPVVMMIAAGLIAGGVAMWSYFNMLSAQLPAARNNAQAHMIAETVMARLRLLLMRDTGVVIGGSTVACPSFGAFRNLNLSTPPTVNNASVALIPSGLFIGNYKLPCLLKSTEATSFLNPTNPMTVTVTPVGTPDMMTMTRSVRVEIVAFPITQAGSLSIPQRIIRNLTLRVALPTDFTLILAGAAGTTPNNRQIQVTGNANLTLELIGAVLHAGTNAASMGSLDIDTVVDTATTLTAPRIPSVSFHKPFFISAPYINNSVFVNYNPYDLKPMFKAGIETNVLGRMHTGTSSPVVYNTNVPGQAGLSTAPQWNIPLDYQTSNPTGFPLPGQPAGFITNWQNHATDPNNPINNYNAVSAQEGTNVTLPQTAPLTVFDRLDKTCAVGNTYVFMRANDNLTLDFTNTGTLPASAGSSSFCGLVVANQLTVNLPATNAFQADTTHFKYALFGTFIVNQLIINGAGAATTTVYLYNPSDQAATAVALPTGQSQAMLYSQWAGRSNEFAHNFFTPLSATGAIGAVYNPLAAFAVSNSVNIGYTLDTASCTDVPAHRSWIANSNPLDYRCLFPDFIQAQVACNPSASNPANVTDFNNVGWFAVESL